MKVLTLCVLFTVHCACAHDSIMSFLGNSGTSVRNLLGQTFGYGSEEPQETYYFTEWSEYSYCDKICGGGYKTRRRQCKGSLGEYHDVSKCSQRSNAIVEQLLTQVLSSSGLISLYEFEKISCNNNPCAVTEWSQPTPCSLKCGTGVQYSTRRCLNSEDQSMCNFVSRSKPTKCNEQNCFRPTEYGQWGECTKQCGGGTKTRTRSCVPNFSTSDPNYHRFQNFITMVIQGNAGVITQVTEGLLYLNNYYKSCPDMIDTADCNTIACPSCPSNQVWHDCKPCTTTCKHDTGLNTNNLLRSLISNAIPMESTGCDGVCVSGCECPMSSPHMDVNGVCYKSNAHCPGNVLYGGIQNGIQTLFYGGQSQVAMETTPEPTTTAYTTTTEEFVVGPRNKMCPYQIAIAQRYSCICDGEWQQTDCYASDQSLCHWECVSKEKAKRVKVKACPNFTRTPILRSGDSEMMYTDNCDDVLECQIDADCADENQDNYMCCDSHCGKRICVAKAYRYLDESP